MQKIKKLCTALGLACLALLVPFVGGAEGNPNPAPGVKYYPFERENIDGDPIKGFVLEVNPKQQLLEIRPVLGRDVLRGTETLSSLAARHGAVAAINGGFFGGDGHPVGTYIQDRQALTSSDILRTSLGFTGSNNVQIGYINPVLAVHLPGLNDRVLVDRLNRWPLENAVGLYTHHWGTQTPQVASSALEIVVDAEGKVERVTSGIGYSWIPKNGYVVALWGNKSHLASGVKVGDKITYGQFFGEQWPNLQHLITGGPLLVDNGIPVFNAVTEGFTGNILLNNPRTAVGEKADGTVLMVVIDGRQPGYSAGVTLEELSYIMVDLGAVRAVNLDGGGSTQMWVKGNTVNQPSGGVERGLSNAILVLHQIPVYLNGERLWFDVPPVLRDNRTLVPLRKIFETLGAEVEFESGVVTAQKDGTTIVLKINERNATINGKVTTLDVPARIVDDRTMVPLRFVGEAMGAKVEWDNPSKTVFIEKGGK